MKANQPPGTHSFPRVAANPGNGKILLFIILHIGLAFLMRSFSIISTIHALITILVGAWIALTSKEIGSSVFVLAYITGAEVLWRMTNAGVFYEYAKYATIAIMFIALLKRRHVKNSSLPILYILLFLPSIILTLGSLGITDRARQLISFNLSGPLATGICILYFLQMDMDQDRMKKLVWSAVYPITGILTLAAYSTLTATEINFGGESVFVTSGGFGPNQVSAILGLGAMLLIMMIIQAGKGGGKIWALILALALITQSFLTFSRGGTYNLVFSLAAAFLFLLRKRDKFISSIFIVFVILLVVGIVIFPQLEQLTAGAFSARFSDTDISSREVLAKGDLELFQENPLIGVGPGMSGYFRGNIIFVAAHTEYTRVLAEHGMFGVLSMLILSILLIKALFKTPDMASRAWVAALAAWPLVEMAHAAMRIVAISFMLGLTVIQWRSPDRNNPDSE